MDPSNTITDILSRATTVDPNSCEPGNKIYPSCASIYGYAPSLAGNAIFLSIFAFSTLVHFAQGAYYRMWTFAVAMCLGGLCEVIGKFLLQFQKWLAIPHPHPLYLEQTIPKPPVKKTKATKQSTNTPNQQGQIGRLLLHVNPLSDPGFKLQLIFLTFAPAFLAAAIYLNLKHLVLTFGTTFSRLKPAWYTWLFISCDIFSIALQGAGGAVAAMADPTETGSGGKKMFDLGNDLMNAGIIVQVVTLVLFGVLSCEFLVRVWRGRYLLVGEVAELGKSVRFKFFLLALGTAYVVILVRCCYRVAEMSGGWGNEIMRDESLFTGLDSTYVSFFRSSALPLFHVVCGSFMANPFLGRMVVIAMISLNLFHPGTVFGRRNRKGEVLDMTPNDAANRSSAIELKGDSLSERFQIDKV